VAWGRNRLSKYRVGEEDGLPSKRSTVFLVEGDTLSEVDGRYSKRLDLKYIRTIHERSCILESRLFPRPGIENDQSDQQSFLHKSYL
jgi:hypothetical protein